MCLLTGVGQHYYHYDLDGKERTTRGDYYEQMCITPKLTNISRALAAIQTASSSFPAYAYLIVDGLTVAADCCDYLILQTLR